MAFDIYDTLHAVASLALAAVLGGVVGWEREAHDRPAGFRTHVLVCVGSALFMVISRQFAGAGQDAGRIAAAVPTGMGFLGAGTILRERGSVRGLTTAASLWTVAAVGLCAGYGFPLYPVATLAALGALVTLNLLSRLERRIPKRHYRNVVIRARSVRRRIPEIQQKLLPEGVEIRSLELVPTSDENIQELRLALCLPAGVDTPLVSEKLMELEQVAGLLWE
jgi:putative Mg2+ transporter-C (MgtC) family protein